jgi:hypothetical protein
LLHLQSLLSAYQHRHTRCRPCTGSAHLSFDQPFQRRRQRRPLFAPSCSASRSPIAALSRSSFIPSRPTLKRKP